MEELIEVLSEWYAVQLFGGLVPSMERMRTLEVNNTSRLWIYLYNNRERLGIREIDDTEVALIMARILHEIAENK